MKKQFLNLGKALNKAEQKLINGGASGPSCQEIFVAGDCCNPVWDRCFPYYSGYCINGSCIL